jgi:hypothetical protein
VLRSLFAVKERLYTQVFRYFVRLLAFNEQRAAHAKTYIDVDSSGFGAGNDGDVGQRADPASGSGELPRAASERDADRETGGV